MPRAGAAAGLVALAAGLEPLPKCPGSAAFVHASCSVEATTSASCTDVVAEIQARVAGQYAAWHDPHNNGTYAIKSQNDQELLLTRTSGSKPVEHDFDHKEVAVSPSFGAGKDPSKC